MDHKHPYKGVGLFLVQMMNCILYLSQFYKLMELKDNEYPMMLLDMNTFE